MTMEECRNIEPLLSAWLDRELTQLGDQRPEITVTRDDDEGLNGRYPYGQGVGS